MIKKELLDLAAGLSGKNIKTALDECALYDKGGEVVWKMKPTGMTKFTIPMGTLEIYSIPKPSRRCPYF